MSDEEPTGLPPIQISKKGSGLDSERRCNKCGEDGRVISNSNGVSVFCNPCKHHWPISTASRAPVTPMAPARGLSKKTLVQPNWDLAYEEDIGVKSGPPDKR